jgi:hypothetical protein
MVIIPGHKGNANQSQVRLLLTPVRMATIKNTDNNNFGENVGIKEPLYTAGMNVN